MDNHTQIPALDSASDLDPLMLTLRAGPILLYDGECGVCSAAVQWILKHEQVHHLRFAALQSPLGQRLKHASQIDREVDSLIWVEAVGQRVRGLAYSNAVLSVVRYVGGVWKFLLIARFLPPSFRDFAYRSFAKHRLLMAPKSCLLPAAEVQTRFLQQPIVSSVAAPFSQSTKSV